MLFKAKEEAKPVARKIDCGRTEHLTKDYRVPKKNSGEGGKTGQKGAGARAGGGGQGGGKGGGKGDRK